jgi:hypothetical protein
MPKPILFPCGGVGQPACPTIPASGAMGVALDLSPDVPLYSYNEMLRHGHNNYLKGKQEGSSK